MFFFMGLFFIFLRICPAEACFSRCYLLLNHALKQSLQNIQIIFKCCCQECKIYYLKSRREKKKSLSIINCNQQSLEVFEKKQNIWRQIRSFQWEISHLEPFGFHFDHWPFQRTPSAQQLSCDFQTFEVSTGRFHWQDKVGVRWWCGLFTEA